MKDTVGTGGEDTDRSQALMASIRDQPKRKRRGARRPFTWNLASIVAFAVETPRGSRAAIPTVTKTGTGSSAKAKKNAPLSPTSQPSNPANIGLPFWRAKGSGTPHCPPPHLVKRHQLHPQPPRRRRHPHPRKEKNPSRLHQHLHVSGSSRVPTNPKSSTKQAH